MGRHSFCAFFAVASTINSVMAAFVLQDAEQFIEQEISECILNISETYFNPELPMAVQTQAMWYPQHDWRKNYGDILLHTLHYYSSITQITIGYKDTEFKNTGRHLKTRNSVHPGSYILQIPEHERYDQINWIQLTFHRIVHDVYNPKGKFVIALNYFPYYTKETVRILLSIALRGGFIDVIILIPRRNSRKSMIPNTEQIDIFGWVPDEQENICSTQISKIKHLDSWNVNRKMFVSKTNLFPKKKMTDMNFCEIRVFIGIFPPFVYEESGMLYGSFPELIQEYCWLSKCEIAAVTEPYNLDIAFPVGYETHFYYRECEFLYPYFNLDFTFYVPAGLKVEPWKSLFRAFTFKMWLLVVICSAFGTLFLWILERFRNTLTLGNPKDDNDVSSNALSAHLNGTNKGPGYTFFLTLWLFYCLLINTAYQSTLFRLMVDPGAYPPIKTFAELKESGLSMKTLIQTIGKKDAQYETCQPYCFETIAEKRNLAALFSTYSGTLSMEALCDNRGNPKVVPLAEIISTRYMLVQIGILSCLVHNTLNSLLHRAIASGLVSYWNKGHRQGWYRLYSRSNIIEHVFALKLFHFQGAFYILVGGLLIAFVTFLVEILLHSYHGPVPMKLSRFMKFLRYAKS